MYLEAVHNSQSRWLAAAAQHNFELSPFFPLALSIELEKYLMENFVRLSRFECVARLNFDGIKVIKEDT